MVCAGNEPWYWSIHHGSCMFGYQVSTNPYTGPTQTRAAVSRMCSNLRGLLPSWQTLHSCVACNAACMPGVEVLRMQPSGELVRNHQFCFRATAEMCALSAARSLLHPLQWPDQGLGWDVAALSDQHPEYRGSCGTCYEVRCKSTGVNDGYGEHSVYQQNQRSEVLYLLLTSTVLCESCIEL